MKGRLNLIIGLLMILVTELTIIVLQFATLLHRV